MSEDTTPTPPPEDGNKTPHENALQDTQLANDIALVKRMIGTIATQPELAAALEPLGYDQGELKLGLVLHADASNTYTKRQSALATATQDLAAREAVAEPVKEEFTTYRETAQAIYKGAERANLGASGRVSGDIEVFETNARSAYMTALTEPHASALAKRGFKPGRIESALAGIENLSTLNTAASASQKAAIAATKARDAAGKKMNAWASELRKVSKANLKKRPDLLALLGV